MAAHSRKDTISARRTTDTDIPDLIVSCRSPLSFPHLFPGDRHLAGPYDLLDADGPEELDDRRDLLFVSRYLERIALLRGVDDAGPEDIGDPERLGPVLGGRIDLDEAHLPLHELLLRKVGHLDDVDQLVELLDDLLEDPFVARGHDRHLRDRGVERRADRDGLDVEPPAAEQSRHPRQHAEFIFHQIRI